VPSLNFTAKSSQPLGAKGLYIHRENADVHDNLEKNLNEMAKHDQIDEAIKGHIKIAL